MKFIFSLPFIFCFLFTPFSSSGRELFIIEKDLSSKISLKKIENIFIKKGISKKMILTKKGNCKKANQKSLVHLCIKNGDIKVVWSNEKVLQNSFGVFGYGKN